MVVSAVIAAGYFVCRWAINAPAVGARDLGLATMFAFFGGVALYAAMAAALVDAILLAAALGRRRPFRAFAIALAVAVSPLIFLALRDRAGP